MPQGGIAQPPGQDKLNLIIHKIKNFCWILKTMPEMESGYRFFFMCLVIFDSWVGSGTPKEHGKQKLGNSNWHVGVL